MIHYSGVKTNFKLIFKPSDEEGLNSAPNKLEFT